MNSSQKYGAAGHYFHSCANKETTVHYSQSCCANKNLRATIRTAALPIRIHVSLIPTAALQIAASIYDLVPKGVQEKRTEVLENKVDRMGVSNAFFLMNTCEIIHQGREKAVLLFVPEKFYFQCDL